MKVLGYKAYNQTMDHSGQSLWRLPHSLHIKTIFCLSLLLPLVVYSSCISVWYIYQGWFLSENKIGEIIYTISCNFLIVCSHKNSWNQLNYWKNHLWYVVLNLFSFWISMKYLSLDVKQLFVWDNITRKSGQEGSTTGDRLSGKFNNRWKTDKLVFETGDRQSGRFNNRWQTVKVVFETGAQVNFEANVRKQISPRVFNIFQVYQYFTIYRQYFFLKFEKFSWYLMQHSLKLGGTNYHFKWVKVSGTAPYWKACWPCKCLK